MLARLRKAQEEREGGFTLIELLVVMIIIGILAAIAIPTFLSQRAKAQDSAVKADVSTVGKELATYYVDGTGTPPVIDSTGGQWGYGTGATRVNFGKASTNVTKINQTGTGATDWCVAFTNANGSQKHYKYSATGGLESAAATGC